MRELVPGAQFVCLPEGRSLPGLSAFFVAEYEDEIPGVERVPQGRKKVIVRTHIKPRRLLGQGNTLGPEQLPKGEMYS